MKKHIQLGHGSGGKLTRELIENIFARHFKIFDLQENFDSALLEIPSSLFAFTTDSFVVDPVFFPGGNIGKLAVAGTVNDLAVSGATPLYLSCGFILEEGLLLEELEEIVKTMAEEARKAGVQIVTGDTKVVEKNKCDKIFINTAGIGVLNPQLKDISSGKHIQVGDAVIINGTIADHGMCIMAQRNELHFQTELLSDCASLNHLIEILIQHEIEIHFMRDATRGGISTLLYELALNRNWGIEVFEEKIPIREETRGLCELLGFDPLYVANEGKVVFIVKKEQAEKALDLIKSHPLGKNASIIGHITNQHPGKAWLVTTIGGKRILDMLSGEQLPRIC